MEKNLFWTQNEKQEKEKEKENIEKNKARKFE